MFKKKFDVRINQALKKQAQKQFYFFFNRKNR